MFIRLSWYFVQFNIVGPFGLKLTSRDKADVDAFSLSCEFSTKRGNLITIAGK